MRKFLIIAGAVLLFLIIAVLIASFFIEEPLRKYVERRMNTSIEGYSVHIEELDLHPLTLSVDLEGVTVVQDKNPSPPIAEVKALEASVHWPGILRGKIVADVHINQPTIRLDLKKLKAEEEDKVPVAEKGWQEMLESAYPFKMNEFTVSDGELYIDQEKMEPVEVRNIQFTARNIRNVEVDDSEYPSPIRLEAVIAGKGSVTVDGRSNILSEPFPSIRADFVIDQVPLASFDLAAGRMFNVDINKGTLRVEGRVQYSPGKKSVTLDQVLLQGARIDYYFIGKEKVPLPEKGKAPGIPVTIQKLRIENSEFGFINRTTKPYYRVFINSVNATMTDFSTGFSKGPAKLDLHGQFMGSGQTDVYGTFRPEQQGPDFDLRTSIRNTKMPAMNNVFRAYGNFDTAAGLFSFFSELHVRNRRVDGYVKPIFKDVKIYAEKQDEKEGLFKKAYEAVLGGLSELLENPREAVATKVPVEGELKSPQLDTWTAIGNLIQNAFFRSILPGFAGSIK